MSEWPTLHGPDYPRWVTDVLKDGTSRQRLVRPLSFLWRLVEGAWQEDDSIFVAQTYPEPIPDYAPDELARIEAAEAKRANRAIRA